MKEISRKELFEECEKHFSCENCTIQEECRQFLDKVEKKFMKKKQEEKVDGIYQTIRSQSKNP